jgi:hypothetical protein
MKLLAASSEELTQAPQPPSPSPEGEGGQWMRKLKWNIIKWIFFINLCS